MALVIAEAGVNHNGSEELARKLIDVAKEAGADIVKFQTFKSELCISTLADKAEYQKESTGNDESQLDMVKRLELSFEAHKRLADYCKASGVEYLSTAFDHQSLAFLVESLGLKTLKLPSGEITNAPLVLAHARTGCDIILSTGMASLSDIELSLGILAFGFTAKADEAPSIEKFKQAYFSTQGQQAIREKVTVLHCTTEYPAPLEDINLTAMHTIKTAFGVRIGYSDHSEGITVPVAAVALGAEVIEKHFTLDRSMEGPDHKASLEPSELKAMIAAIRDVEKSLGDGIKGPRPSELKNIEIARKSLVAAVDIKEGEVFSESNLTVKRPGGGISPLNYWSMLGTVAKKSYQRDELIEN
ncbi:N-acetylneuraminate synthase [Vibrio sinaloensis]|uniref:N-acetylneuraminate synthase n=1 Tax=Photobacterium sp. (strain ATCC 43367) TaxID=379097 RepID=UPI0035EF9A0D